jgi:hypothetical protein
MKAILPGLLAVFSVLGFIPAHAGQQVIYTFIEPSCCSTPGTFTFSIDQEKAAAMANEAAYRPEFTVKAETAIDTVHKYLQARYPGSDQFLVFGCTLGWYGMEKPDKSIKGFQFVFVRSEIHAPPTPEMKTGDPREVLPSRLIYPCYELVLPDGTVLEADRPAAKVVAK